MEMIESTTPGNAPEVQAKDAPAVGPGAAPDRSGSLRRSLEPLDQLLWRGYVDANGRLLGQLDADLVALHGITLSEYEVLAHLAEAPAWQLRMSELAGLCGLSPSGLTRRFDAMTRRGLVDRRRCEDDRRGVWALLTEAGHESLTAAVPTHVDGVNRYFLDTLNADHRAVLAEAFGRISAAVTRERERSGQS